MKTIGLIGGMSWESSAEYYRLINQMVKEVLGPLHSCKSILQTVDFSEIEQLQHKGDWEQLTDMMIEIAKNLENAGADFIIICTNTMHMMAEDVQASISIPLLHIADAAGQEIVAKNLQKVALLGTKFTMSQDFYKGRIHEKYGVDVIVPTVEEQEIVHNIIYNELVQGFVKQSSKAAYQQIIENLVTQGAQGIILGCTEIPMLIQQGDASVPIFDTTYLHAKSAVQFALEDK